jgi:hypothetical protein
VKESGLVDLARQVVRDEDILAAGVFAPAGSAEGAAGAAGAAGAVAGVTGDLSAAMPVTTIGLASGRIASIAEGVPRFTLVALTDTKLYLIGVHSVVQWVTFTRPTLFRVFDRSTVSINVQLHHLMPSVLTVVDLDRNEAYHFEGSNSSHSGGHQHEVLEMLGPTQPREA